MPAPDCPASAAAPFYAFAPAPPGAFTAYVVSLRGARTQMPVVGWITAMTPTGPTTTAAVQDTAGTVISVRDWRGGLAAVLPTEERPTERRWLDAHGEFAEKAIEGSWTHWHAAGNACEHPWPASAGHIAADALRTPAAAAHAAELAARFRLPVEYTRCPHESDVELPTDSYGHPAAPPQTATA